MFLPVVVYFTLKFPICRDFSKEHFSDKVGYSWIDGILDHADKVVTDVQLAKAKFRFPEKTPKTKEAYLYREMFSKHFGEQNANSIQTVEWQDSIACR